MNTLSLSDALNGGRFVFDVPLVWASTPTNFRLARKPDGELILQGEYQWRRGFNEYGSEWQDLETVGWEKENGQD